MFLFDWYFVCSAVGSGLIVGGLYLVLWGKGREMDADANANATVPDEEMVPDDGTGLAVFLSPKQEH